MSSTQKRLDTGIEPEMEQLKDTVGSGFEGEIIGYGVMYTVGADFNCLVPRDWLLDRISDLGIPQWVAPRAPTPLSAYKRTIKRMKEDYLETYHIEAPRMDSGVPEDHRVEVSIKDGDEKYLKHVYAEVFFDEEESAQDGGKWVQHHLGHFMYSSENQQLIYQKDEKLDEDHLLHSVWSEVSSTGIRLFSEMKETHLASDIREMMYYSTRDYTRDVIKLRRSVYLFPAGMSKFVESMAQLYREIDEQWKDGGEPVAIRTFEVLNTDEKREWVQSRVEATLEENVENILSEGFDQFDEGETADTVVKAIRERLSEDEQTAETYNALLEAQIDVEEALKEQKQEIANSEKENIIERVMEDQEILAA